LGVVRSRDRTFVAVDIPGLIEGAHVGRGLGIQFLQHIERTKVLIHLLDGTSENLKADWEMINKEIRLYDERLTDIPQVITINKIDIPEVRERIKDLKKLFSGLDPLFISAATGEGIDSLWDKVLQVLEKAKSVKDQNFTFEDIAVIRPDYKKEHKVYKEGNVFVVDSSQAERISALVDEGNWKAMLQLYRRLDRLGVIDALKTAGVEEGSIVRIGKLEMVWQ
jgi:GTP-binding protein